MSVEDGIPEAGQATQPHDWERDYKALQAEYTRSQQSLKEHEGLWEDDEALSARLREARPQWFEDDETETPEPDYEEDDPVAPLRSKVEQFETWQAAGRIRTRRSALQPRPADGARRDEGPREGDRLDQGRTAALGNNPKALKQAVEEYRAIEEELRGPVRKPTPPPQPGKAGEQKTDPRDRNARRARMAAAIEAANQQ
jgi:hypothetical protein